MRTVIERTTRRADHLYRLEEELQALIRTIAAARQRVQNVGPDFFGDQLPQVLYDLLDRWDREAVHLACLTWISDHIDPVGPMPQRPGDMRAPGPLPRWRWSWW